MTRRWLGYHNAPDAEIDQEELAREFPDMELDRDAFHLDVAERMHEGWLDRIGGSA